MNNVKERLVIIDQILSKITLSGDNVMLMAAARQELKNLFDQLQNDNGVSPDG